MSDRIDGLGIAVLLSAETEYGHWLFDQLVRTDQEGHREGKVKRFRHPIIDDQLKGDGIGMSPGLVPLSTLSIK